MLNRAHTKSMVHAVSHLAQRDRINQSIIEAATGQLPMATAEDVTPPAGMPPTRQTDTQPILKPMQLYNRQKETRQVTVDLIHRGTLHAVTHTLHAAHAFRACHIRSAEVCTKDGDALKATTCCAHQTKPHSDACKPANMHHALLPASPPPPQ